MNNFPSISEEAVWLEFSYIAVGSTSTLENNLLYLLNIYLPYDTEIALLDTYSIKMLIITEKCSEQHCSEWPKLGTAHMFISKNTDKWLVTYSHNGISHSNLKKKGELLIPATKQSTLKSNDEWRKPGPRARTVWFCLYELQNRENQAIKVIEIGIVVFEGILSGGVWETLLDARNISIYWSGWWFHRCTHR